MFILFYICVWADFVHFVWFTYRNGFETAMIDFDQPQNDPVRLTGIKHPITHLLIFSPEHKPDSHHPN